MTVDAGEVWQRLSPRMLLVHPVHEVLRQIPLLIGSVVLGSATGNPMWALFGLALVVGFGVARWFTTTYRIDARRGTAADGCASAQGSFGAAQQDSLGVDRRAAVAPAARTDGAAGEHGSGGQGRRRVRARRGAGRAGAPPAERFCWRIRWLLPRTSASEPGRELARWQPSWLRYSPLSFTGLAMILAAVGLAYQAGAGAALENSRLAQSGVDAAERFGVVASVVVVAVAVLVASVVLSVLRSLVTYGNLVLRRDADALHLEHGLLRVREHTFDMRRLRGGTLREPLLVRLFGGARLDAVMTGVDGAGEASLLLPPCPRATAEAVLAELIARPEAVTGPLRGARRGGDAQALDAGAGAACGAAGRDGCGVFTDAGVAVAGVGGADGVLRAAGVRPVAGAGASGGRAVAGGTGRQPRPAARLHRRGGNHRVDGAPDAAATAGGGGDVDRCHRGGGEELSGDRRSGRAGVVDRGPASPWVADSDWASGLDGARASRASPR